MLQINMKVLDCTRLDCGSEEHSVGKTLATVLLEAQADHRLTCGLYESGLSLEMKPDSVMVCVLPVNKSHDVTLDIHFTLIEAFCLENDITTIKVDSSEKLSELLGSCVGESLISERPPLDVNDNDFYLDDTISAYPEGSTDFNCVIIEYPAEKCSEHEAELLEFHKRTCEMIPQPIVNLDI